MPVHLWWHQASKSTTAAKAAEQEQAQSYPSIWTANTDGIWIPKSDDQGHADTKQIFLEILNLKTMRGVKSPQNTIVLSVHALREAH